MPAGQLAATARVLRGVLRSPSLRRVMAAFLLFAAIEYGTWVALLLYAYDAIGPESVGLVAVVQLLPTAAFAAVAASIADRYPRQRVLVAGYGLQALTLAMTAAAMLAGASPVVVIVAAVAGYCAMTITRPAHWALLPALARTPDELTAANGVAGSVEGVGAMTGPLAAAAVLVVASPGAVFGVAAIAAGVSTLLVVGLRPQDAVSLADPDGGGAGHPDDALGIADAPDDDERADADRMGWLARTRSALAALDGGRDTRLIVLLLSAQAFVIGATDVLFVLLALDVLGIGESGAGLLGAALGFGSILGGVAAFTLVGRRRMAPVFAAGALLLGGACVALGVATATLVAVALIAIGGVGAASLDVAGRMVLQRVADPRSLTRALGALEGVGILAMAAGSLAAPIIATAASVQVALVATGLVLPIAIVLAWLPLRAIDRTVRVPVRELSLLRVDRILAPLPGPTLETVASAARWITLDPGEVLIREGDAGDRYYVLESGALQITQRGRTLRETERERGYGLGEIALLRDVPRTATATATAPSVLLAVARPDFLEAVTGHEQARAAARRTADDRDPVPGAT